MSNYDYKEGYQAFITQYLIYTPLPWLFLAVLHISTNRIDIITLFNPNTFPLMYGFYLLITATYLRIGYLIFYKKFDKIISKHPGLTNSPIMALINKKINSQTIRIYFLVRVFFVAIIFIILNIWY